MAFVRPSSAVSVESCAGTRALCGVVNESATAVGDLVAALPEIQATRDEVERLAFARPSSAVSVESFAGSRALCGVVHESAAGASAGKMAFAKASSPPSSSMGKVVATVPEVEAMKDEVERVAFVRPSSAVSVEITDGARALLSLDRTIAGDDVAFFQDLGGEAEVVLRRNLTSHDGHDVKADGEEGGMGRVAFRRPTSSCSSCTKCGERVLEDLEVHSPSLAAGCQAAGDSNEALGVGNAGQLAGGQPAFPIKSPPATGAKKGSMMSFRAKSFH